MSEYGLGGRSEKKRTNLRWLYLFIMVFLAFAGMVVATQRVAEFYGYQRSLGPHWFIWQETAWYAPWSIFKWQRSFTDHFSYMEHSVTIGQAVFLVPQFIILGCWFTRRKMKGVKDLHGSAHWATEDEIQDMGYFSSAGVYVGGWVKKYAGIALILRILSGRPSEEQLYLRHNGPEHIMVFAPTRSGKGVGLILPTLLAWSASSLVLDIKGENWALTSGYLQSQGHTTLRFDPCDPSGAACGFNPLEEVRLNTLLAIMDVQSMAAMIADPEGKGMSDHWTKAAFAFFSGLILHCCIMIPHQKQRPATMTDLILMMADEARTTEELLQEMLETNHAAILRELYQNPQGADEAHTFIASSAREMLNKDEKEASGVLSSAAVNMSLYRDPIVALNTARSDFKIEDLMNHEHPVNLYLVIPPSDDRLVPLIRLMVDMIIRRVCAKMEFADGASVAGYKHRLLLMLDEFTSLGKLPIIEKAIAYIAGYGGKMYLIVQDITQLNGVYGKDNALMANCHTRIAYAPNTIDTAKILSEMTGKTTVVETKTSLSGSRLGSMKNASMSVSETARPLLTPDECMRLPGLKKDARGDVIPGDMLIFTAGNSAIYGKQILYFRDPVFSKRAKIPAPGISPSFPAGITDSLYYPRTDEWKNSRSSSQIKQDSTKETHHDEPAENFEQYFQ